MDCPVKLEPLEEIEHLIKIKTEPPDYSSIQNGKSYNMLTIYVFNYQYHYSIYLNLLFYRYYEENIPCK